MGRKCQYVAYNEVYLKGAARCMFFCLKGFEASGENNYILGRLLNVYHFMPGHGPELGYK